MPKILDDLEEQVHSAAKRASKLENEYRRTEKRLKKEANLRISETLRSRLVQEIEAITEEVDREIAAMEEQFRFFPNIFGGKEIWVYGLRRSIDERSQVTFHVMDVHKEYARELRVDQYQVRCAPADEFARRLKTLKSSIKNGSFDQMLRMKGDEALWEVLGYNGEYLAVFQDRSISLQSSGA